MSDINKNEISKSSILSYGVFAFSVSIVLLCCVSVIFPALISSVTSEFKEFSFYTPQVDPFEIGALATPFVIVNGIVLLIGIIYYKKHYSLNRVFDFDVSKKIAIIVISIILSSYIITTVPEFEKNEALLDWQGMEVRLNESIRDNRFTFEEVIRGNPNYSAIEPHVKYSLLIISEKVFGDYRVIAFFASIVLLIVTFFITKEITKKRVPGILAMLLVLQSNTFLSYDTSATYSNFWILFYVLSLYLVLKKWQLSQFSFVLAIFSKLLSTVFLPLSIFFVLNNTEGKKRMYILIFYTILIVSALLILINSDLFSQINSMYLPENFMKGFTQFAYQLRFDPIMLIFLLPLTVALFLKSLKGFTQANSIQILISGFLLIPPLLITFSAQTNEPYRLIPLVVFFAIGVSTLLTKIKQDES